jgi:hypothetical protein
VLSSQTLFFIKAPDENFSIQQNRDLPVTEEAELYVVTLFGEFGDSSLFPLFARKYLLFQMILLRDPISVTRV